MTSEMAKQNNPSMLPISSPSQSRSFMVQIVLRVLVIALALAATFVMVTSKQSIELLGFIFHARYSYSSAYKFLFGADIAVCGITVLSLIFVCLLSRKGSNPKNYFFLFLVDMATMVLMVSGCAAATAIGYVAIKGQPKMGWVSVCDNVNKFCHQVTISVVLSYLAFLSCLVITTMSASKLMSRATE